MSEPALLPRLLTTTTIAHGLSKALQGQAPNWAGAPAKPDQARNGLIVGCGPGPASVAMRQPCPGSDDRPGAA